MNNRITVIITTYKSTQNIIERSIKSVLNQSVSPFEIIVVDDNDNNEFRNTSLIIENKYKDRIIFLYNEENKGANYSRNRGILSSHGDYIAFLDADDEWDCEYIKTVTREISENNAYFITVNYQVVHKEGILPPEFSSHKNISGDISKIELYRDVVGPTSTVIVKRSLLIEAGLFDESLPARQDYDMWLRVCKNARLSYIYNPMVKVYRDGHDSISSSYIRNVDGTKKVLAKILTTNSLNEKEIKMIEASHLKHMSLACILCHAYKDSRIYARKSLVRNFDFTLASWYILSYFPKFFDFIRNYRRRMKYIK